MACCTACAQSSATSSTRNRVRVRTHPRRVSSGVTVVSEHARSRVRTVKPPPTYRSHKGRTFTIGRSTKGGPMGVQYPVFFEGKQVGDLWPTMDYNREPNQLPKWSASLRELVWSGDIPPTGLGFDVAARDTPRDTLAAMTSNADDVLDWREGKAVRSIYAGGRAHRESGQKEGIFQRNRVRALRGSKQIDYVRVDHRSGFAYVTWKNGSTTSGQLSNTHMNALLSRAKREGKSIREFT